MKQTFCVFLLLACGTKAVAQRTSGLDIYDSGGSSVKRQSLRSGTHDIYNVTQASRLFLSSAGGLSTTTGIMQGLTGAAGSETIVWQANGSGFSTNQLVTLLDSSGVTRMTHQNSESNWLNSGGMLRIFASAGGGTSSSVGVLRGYTGAAGVETQSWGLDSLGVTTTGQFRARNASGFHASIGASATMGADYSMVWPDANAAGCIENDGSGNLSFTPCATGNFVTTDTAQTILSTADKDIESVFTWVSGGVDRVQIAPAQQTMWNSGAASRVFMSSSGGTSTTVGIVRVQTGAAGSESTVASMDTAGLTVQGDSRNILMLDSSGNTKVRVSPNIAGSISRLELLGSGGTTTLVDFQAGGSGGSFKVALDATGANGVTATTGGLLYTHTLNFYDAAGSGPVGINVAGFGRGGAATMALPASMGVTGDCYKITNAATGQHGYGACGGSGDMLLGTVQTVTARKDFQMTAGGDAIRINNTFGATKGFFNDAQWYFGDSGGRGVSTNNSGIQITNTSGTQVFSISTLGVLNVWDAALGTVRNGLTITCSVGQTVRQPVHVQGILMSGGCGI